MTLAADMTGQRFGKLLVIARDGVRNGLAAWLCKCDCGRQHIATGANLRKGMTTSCGCGRVSTPLVEPGTRVAMLTVVAYAGRVQHRHAYTCKCECGGERVVREDLLLKERVRSCGCVRGRNAA